MAQKRPKTEAKVACHECGHPMVRKSKAVMVRYGSLSKSVEVTGRYCTSEECDGSLLIGKESKPIERAMLALKAESEGLMGPDEVARIRKRLRLTQRQASELLGGGTNAFHKYEGGVVLLSRAMHNLLRLLDDEPALLKKLTSSPAKTQGKPSHAQRKKASSAGLHAY